MEKWLEIYNCTWSKSNIPNLFTARSSLSIEPPNNCRLVSRPRNLNVNIGRPSISETIEAYNTSGFHRSYEEKCERSSSVRPPNERSDPAANWLKTHITDGDNNSTKGDKQRRGSRSQRCTRFNRRAWIWNLMCSLSISTWNHDLYINHD